MSLWEHSETFSDADIGRHLRGCIDRSPGDQGQEPANISHACVGCCGTPARLLSPSHRIVPPSRTIRSVLMTVLADDEKFQTGAATIVCMESKAAVHASYTRLMQSRVGALDLAMALKNMPPCFAAGWPELE